VAADLHVALLVGAAAVGLGAAVARRARAATSCANRHENSQDDEKLLTAK
jgi:hypothetical protein